MSASPALSLKTISSSSATASTPSSVGAAKLTLFVSDRPLEKAGWAVAVPKATRNDSKETSAARLGIELIGITRNPLHSSILHHYSASPNSGVKALIPRLRQNR